MIVDILFYFFLGLAFFGLAIAGLSFGFMGREHRIYVVGMFILSLAMFYGSGDLIHKKGCYECSSGTETILK